MSKEGFTKIEYFMTPGTGVLVVGRGHISHVVKCINSLRIFLYSQAKIRQTKYITILTQGDSNEIINVINPGAGVLVLGRGHMVHIVKMHYFL